MIRVKIRGDRKARAQLRQMIKTAPKAAAKSLYRSCNKVMTEAKKITPVETGVLRASGRVDKPIIRPDGVVVRLGFGGPAVPYAIVQHEEHGQGEPQFRHDPPQQWKYLETPALAAEAEVREQLVTDLTREIRRDLG